METSTGGEGLKCSNNNTNTNDSNNNNSNNSNNTQPNGNNSSNNSNSNNNNNNNNNNVSSSMLKIRQFHSASPPLHHSLINAGHEQLTELTSSEISLDLQGLIDDSQFGDENLFGDLMDGKKNAVDLINNNTLSSSPYGPLHPHHVHGHGHGHPHHHQHQRTSPTNSLGGSSGVSSPGTGDAESSSYYTNNSGGRHTLAYVPGSVHQASYAPIPNNNNTLNPHPINNSQQHDIRVKQEPAESPSEFAARQQAYSNNGSNNNNNNAPYSNGTVSSTTPSPPSHLYMGNGSPLKALSNPSGTTKYIHANISSNANSNSNSSLLPGLKKKTAIGERCSDEYRRRRERNNVAVRKSREKAKIRTRETEERVKILARENERLQKKVELLQEELSVLRSLFSNVGVLPDHIHRELSKHMDSFQAQHNAMAAGTI